MKNNWNIDEIQAAWHLASRLHNGQKYGGHLQNEKIEYINHIGSVTFEILNSLQFCRYENANLAIKCAILHDTIEDTAFDYEQTLLHFGKKVADGVLALTKSENLDTKQARMQDSLQRIKQQPHEIWSVKMADRIVNLYAPPYYWTSEKKQKYLEEAKIIHAELKDGNAYLAARLAQKITDYQLFLSQ